MPENSMKIFPYPTFDEVFKNKTLEGIFYPLCSVEYVIQNSVVKLHFISSNGLWMDESFSTETNTFSYTLFDIVEDRYQFSSDIRLYKGCLQAQEIFPKLVADFQENGITYLNERVSTQKYIVHQKEVFNLASYAKLFDVEYYLQTFYEFSINRLYYSLYHEFGIFRGLIDKWAKPKQKSPIVYGASSKEVLESLHHYDQPLIENIQEYQVVGQIIGCEFFTDGNDTILLYHAPMQKALCVNFYS